MVVDPFSPDGVRSASGGASCSTLDATITSPAGAGAAAVPLSEGGAAQKPTDCDTSSNNQNGQETPAAAAAAESSSPSSNGQEVDAAPTQANKL